MTSDAQAAPPPVTAGEGGGARTGVIYALSGFSLWGLSPAYWKLLTHVAPFEILAHRVVWSVFFVGMVMLRGDRLRGLLKALKAPKVLLALVGTTALISLNWLTFIWAVANDRVLDTSLGYFMNPLVSVALGLVVLGERLNRAQMIAVGLAFVGVVNLTLASGVPPWLPLMLAFSFGLYGLVRKVIPVGALEGLFAETLVMLPIGLGYLLWVSVQGTGAFGRDPWGTDIWLVLAGPVTAVPLLLFSLGARRVRLSTLGLTQYIAPTIQFILAVVAFGETVTSAHLVTFVFIWIGLAVFSLDSWRRERHQQNLMRQMR